MPALNFEWTTIPISVIGEVNYYELVGGGSYAPVITSPNPSHIQGDQPWQVELQNLTQSGAIFAAFGGNRWRFRVYFEQIGSGEHNPGYYETFFGVVAAAYHVYPNQVISMRPRALDSGLYKVYAELVMLDSSNLTPIAGAGELTPSGTVGKVLQIINA